MMPLKEVNGESCDYLDAPPGFSGKVSGTASVEGTICESHIEMSPVVDQVDDSPGFSQMIKLKQWDSSSEVTPKLKKQNTGRLGLHVSPNSGMGTAVSPNSGFENSESIGQEVDNKVLNMEMDILGGKEDERVDNFMATCTSSLDISSKCVSSGNVLSQVSQKRLPVTYLQEVNSGNSDYMDGPLGFSGCHTVHPVQECYDQKNLHQVESECCDDLNASRFSRTITSSDVAVRPIAALQVETPPVADKVDAPPGFSELIKHK